MLLIENARVVTPRETRRSCSIFIENGKIEWLDASTTSHNPSNGQHLDADGCIVIPGIVDLHGDSIELELTPRGDVELDPRVAIYNADRKNLLNGITTKYHAIAFEDVPQDTRSIAQAIRLCRAIDSHSSLNGDARIHARCELTEKSIEALESIINDISIDLISMMHHEPGVGQYQDVDSFAEKYGGRQNESAGDLELIIQNRTGSTTAELQTRARHLAKLAIAYGIPLASHDDDTATQVEWNAEQGVNISEFPVTIEAARRANELGLSTAMGAPNVVNGRSLWGNLSARQAISENILDILCADYHPPSLLASIFVDTGEKLHRKVARVTKNPADAVGLVDRGRIEPGAKADLVVIDPFPYPTVRSVIVDGKESLRIGT